ncbi:serpin family protein [Streptomyces sp. NPDC088097]|uniref:serpin family protein n=1 Tax=Streptomyces sp. NPDC088097 TaxID=3365823 RepID=UPI003826299E
MRNSTVRAVNALTSRWAGALPDGGTVFTAAGVWPLLGLLAGGAAGAARAELAGALGLSAEEAPAAARELLSALEGVRGLRAATGLWSTAGSTPAREWLDTLPEGARGTLGGDDPAADRALLDGWAAERTGGEIGRVPVDLPKDARGPSLVLASALSLRLNWIRPFDAWPGEVYDGPWAGRILLLLRRDTALLDRVGVARADSGTVTLLEVVGDAGVDVHLVLGGPGAAPGEVLTTGIEAVTRARATIGASRLPDGEPGPGLTLTTVPATTREPRLLIETPAFEVRAEHDLLHSARLFGLESARDPASHLFPGISGIAGEPVFVGSAAQSAVGRFHARGFEAAAVTTIAMAAGGLPRFPHRARHAEVSFHHPFGFLAVHRTSRLVLAAGWVTEPCAYEEREEHGEHADSNAHGDRAKGVVGA